MSDLKTLGPTLLQCQHQSGIASSTGISPAAGARRRSVSWRIQVITPVTTESPFSGLFFTSF